jgi:hypothetical protein
MHPLAQRIASLRRRLILTQRAVAACWIVATVITVALVLGMIDFLLRISDTGLRVMATLALAAAATWAVYHWWYRRGRRRWEPLTVARKVETEFPRLRDSLASAMEFLEQSEDDHSAGSAQLRRLVVTDAQTAIDGLPLERIIDRRPLYRAARALAIAGVALSACLALDARAVGTALVRLVAPLGSTEWPRQHHLSFRNPPTRLAAGQAFEVELVDTAGPLPDEVRIEYRVAAGGEREWSSEPMSRAGEVMIARRENVRESFAFRATGGDDHKMPWRWVEVVEAPRLESLDIAVHPPAYTGLSAVPAARHLEVLAGSGIELHGTANEPLEAARILLGETNHIDAQIGPDAAGRERRAFHVRPDQWVAAESGQYKVELVDLESVAGVVGQWNLRVEPDPPPVVSWRRPMDDLYVTAGAIVPIELSVTDNLLTHRVELLYEPANRPGSSPTGEPTPARVELYRGAEKPAPIGANNPGRDIDHRVVEFAWDLARLQLDRGTQLTLHAEASDYRPGVGRTVGPRHIHVISAGELDARIADHQMQIVRRLEQVLSAQRATREDVRRLEIQQRDAEALTGGDRNALQTTEVNQRRLGQNLVDPTEGVPAHVNALLTEIDINRLSIPDLRKSIERLLGELERLSKGPLGVAERELVASRKIVDGANPNREMTDDQPLSLDATQSGRLADSLTAAGSAQNEVIIALEQLIDEFSGQADYRQLILQLAKLRENQLAHEKVARKDIGLETLPLQLSELTRAQRARLNNAAAAQNAIAGRFERIEQAMDRLAQELAEEKSDVAQKLTEAVELARRLAIASTMHTVARDFSENRIGQALMGEAQIAADLERVRDILREGNERRPDQLLSGLREAEQRLATLRNQLAEHGRRMVQAEQQSAASADSERLKRLADQQQSLQRDIEQLSRQLDRLQAAEASRSAYKAANRLARRGPEENQRGAQAQRPGSSQDVQQAEQDLDEAARQLAQHRQQAEDELALEFIRRLEAELGQMVERQQRVIDDTDAADAQRPQGGELSQSASQAISQLAGEERQLAELARQHSELLFGLGAVRTRLEEAARRLEAAASLLDDHETGRRVQQAEQAALEQLNVILQALAQTASEAAQNRNPTPPADPDEAADQPPRRRPTFELLEVKILRMLQVDLNERTQSFQQRMAGISGQSNGPQRAELAREARELQAEQARLAELVSEMLTRDNERDGEK